MTTLSAFNFKALIDFYDFQTFGPLEITKVIFYMMVQGLAPVFMGLIALVAKLIGIDSVEVNYQVKYLLSSLRYNFFYILSSLLSHNISSHLGKKNWQTCFSWPLCL